MERKILKNAEAAKLLGVTEGALRQLRFKKKIPYYKNRTNSRVYYLLKREFGIRNQKSSNCFEFSTCTANASGLLSKKQ